MKAFSLLRPTPLLLLALTLPLGAAVLLEDNFRSAAPPQRKPATARGEWKIAEGMATSIHNDELYKKNKNHGAVMWYDLNFRDAVLTFSFRAERCQTVGFTLNNAKGHVFRFRQTDAGLDVLAWASQNKDTKATPLHRADDRGPALAHGKWTNVELRFAGPKVTVTVGDSRRTYENAGLAVEKSRFGISYDLGAFSVRDVKVESVEAKP